MIHEQIAIALEISVDTLQKYYATELAVGSTQRRMAVLEAMYKAATGKGSTSAAKVYLANEPQMAVPPVPQAAPGASAPAPAPAAEAPAPAPVVKLGKKEQAAADAVTAADGTPWDNLLPRPGTPLQ